ncbi:MAG TPA: GTP cyclohydrolase I FolE, partial [Aequorivita sp.]|nr:GTP cyclohydrolase I FolE [Aequorivita sp.]
MDLEKQLKEIEAIGNDHIGSSTETPMRPDAFELSDIEKIASIKKDVQN